MEEAMHPDEQHLDLLSVFHYVVAGLAALFSLLPTLHLTIGLMLATGRLDETGDPIAQRVGAFFSIFAAGLILAGLTFAVLVFLAGRFLSRRRHYNFCLGMAGVMCVFMPLGTVLGVFTILVLMRSSVRARFGLGSSASAGFTPSGPEAAGEEGAIE